MTVDYEFEEIVLSQGFVNQKITSAGLEVELKLSGHISSNLSDDTYFKSKIPDVTRKYFYYTLDTKSGMKLQQLSTLAAKNLEETTEDWQYVPCIAVKGDKKEIRLKIKFHENVLVDGITCNNHESLVTPKGSKARIVCEPNVYYNCDDKKFGLYFNVKQIVF